MFPSPSPGWQNKKSGHKNRNASKVSDEHNYHVGQIAISYKKEYKNDGQSTH
jgi:hypothetical protein